MNINDSSVSIVDLPDEILLIIFKNRNNFDVLYSLVGINHKLDKVARDQGGQIKNSNFRKLFLKIRNKSERTIFAN
jgi:hypothetical protein